MLRRYSPLLLVLSLWACARPDDAALGRTGQPRAATAAVPAADSLPRPAPAEVAGRPGPTSPRAAAEATGASDKPAGRARVPEADEVLAARRHERRPALRATSLAAAPEAPGAAAAGAGQRRRGIRAAALPRRAAARANPEQAAAAPLSGMDAMPTVPAVTFAGPVAGPDGAAAGPDAAPALPIGAELLPETAWGGLPGPPTQVFRLQAGLDTTVAGVRGTTLALPANAFAYADDPEQKAVMGTVEVRLREFVTVADMVLNGLHTASGDNLLETGGMVQLTARTPDGRPCQLRPGAAALVRLPAPRPVAGMQLFRGVPAATGRVDWQSPRRALRPRQLRAGAPVFRAGVPLRLFLQKRLACSEATLRELRRSPQRLRRKMWHEGRRVRVLAAWKAVIMLDSAGRARGVRQTAAPTPELQANVERAVAQLPAFLPAYLQAPAEKQPRQRRRTLGVKPPRLRARGLVPVWLTVTKRGRVLVKTDKGRPVYPAGVEDPGAPNAEATRQRVSKLSEQELAALETRQLGGYLFTASSLGWLNCDRFYRSNEPKILFTVRDTQPEDLVCLVFHNLRAVLSGTSSRSHHEFRQIPRGEPVTVLALRRRGAELEMAMTQTVVAGNPLGGLNYQPVTPAQLQTVLHQLDRIGQPGAGSLSSR